MSDKPVVLVGRKLPDAVEVRLARHIAEVWPAEIERVVPAASQRLPSRALGTTGGGEWAVDTSDPDNTVRWLIESNTAPTGSLIITVRVIPAGTIPGSSREVTLTSIRGP